MGLTESKGKGRVRVVSDAALADPRPPIGCRIGQIGVKKGVIIGAAIGDGIKREQGRDKG